MINRPDNVTGFLLSRAGRYKQASSVFTRAITRDNNNLDRFYCDIAEFRPVTLFEQYMASEM